MLDVEVTDSGALHVPVTRLSIVFPPTVTTSPSTSFLAPDFVVSSATTA